MRVRRQRWTVVAVRRYDDCKVLTLTGIGPRNAGAARCVVMPFEHVEPLEPQGVLRRVPWRRWRALCRTALVGQGDAGTLRSASHARIALMPHQLEPALALVRGLSSRILLADEVGLGKTIQAGLAVSALQDTGGIERTLVLTPAGLRDQWIGELSRFGLDAALCDMPGIRRRTARLPVGENPWATVPLAVASVDYAKRPEVLPAILACPWDIVVVDEAHGLATSGSDRREAVDAICRRTPYVLLLTATPHNGDQRAFLSLCGLGAPDAGTLLVFRRTRQEVSTGTNRRVHRLMVRPSAEERLMHGALARFAKAVRTDRGDGDREAWLALTVLHKRAFSSPYALERSVVRRLECLQNESPLNVQQLALPLGEEDEFDARDDAPMVSAPLLTDGRREREYLLHLAQAAHLAVAHDSKRSRIVRLAGRLGRIGESAIIFTEYRDTLLHLEEALPGECVLLHGGLTTAERRAALQTFVNGRRRFLLATDAAGEGLNLHMACRLVVNLELPWNPVRLEQRIGRVDRIGQGRTVHAVHLVLDDTGETRILRRLQARVAQSRADVGGADSLGTPAPGHAEEDVASRLVVGYAAARERPDEPAESSGPRMGLRLSQEADVEHARLVAQRRLAIGAGSTARAGLEAAWVTEARRPVLRMLTGSRALVFVEARCEDGCGRVVATHLTPLLATVRGSLVDFVQGLGALPLSDIDAAFGEWQKRTLRIHSAFWTERLRREREIELVVLDDRTRRSQIFQPGLFDRRADHTRLQSVAAEAVLQDEFERRLRMVEAARTVRFPPPRVRLVLLPRRPKPARSPGAAS